MWPTLTRTTTRYVLHARLLWRAAPGLSLLALLITALGSLAMTAALITSGRLIGALAGLVADGPGSPAADRAWFWFAWTAAAFAVAPLCEALGQLVTQRVSARYLVTTYGMLLEIGTHPYGVADFDDAAFAGRLSGLHQAMRDWTFLTGIDSTWVVVGTRISGLGALVVTCTWRWWAALVLVATYVVLSKTVVTWIDTFYDDLLDVSGNARREATYVRTLLTRGDTGKEVRLFGLTGFLLERFRTTWLAPMTVLWQRRNSTLRPVMWSLSLAFAVNVGALALLGRDAFAGAVSIGALATLVQAIVALTAFGPMGDPQSALARNTTAAHELVALRRSVGLPALPGPAVPQEPRPPGRGAAAAIDLAGVGFTYPTREEPAFSDLTLHVPAGQSVGIVGVNGAGKSTLIKLLCGLYPPNAGTVRVDGRDPGTDPAARRRIAVIFQDFVRYELPLRDNVAFGAGTAPLDDAALSAALAEAGGADLLNRLDQGWDTPLSPGYAEGTDLSGGQWQRVALARAFAALAAGAGVLVLDEPTAALDVRAEAMLFERFLAVTRGTTTLLVSHRLSSVRHADRIVVIGPGGDGRGAIVEDGSHEELMAAGGRYAQMFSLQARRFAAAGATGDPVADDAVAEAGI